MEGRQEGVESLDRAYDLSSLSGEVGALGRGDRSMQQRHEAYLEWKHDPCLEEEHALLSTGESGGDRCLVGVSKTAAASDRLSDSPSSGVAEAILDGGPPFRVASLPDPVVHGECSRRVL
jgi:hypothetical protein